MRNKKLLNGDLRVGGDEFVDAVGGGDLEIVELDVLGIEDAKGPVGGDVDVG